VLPWWKILDVDADFDRPWLRTTELQCQCSGLHVLEVHYDGLCGLRVTVSAQKPHPLPTKTARHKRKLSWRFSSQRIGIQNLGYPGKSLDSI